MKELRLKIIKMLLPGNAFDKQDLINELLTKGYVVKRKYEKKIKVTLFPDGSRVVDGMGVK